MLLLETHIYAANTTLQEPVTVKGVVGDASGPLPGVNIRIKGTTTGVITETDGSYSIHVPDAKAVLVFSFVGYASQEVEVGDQRTVNITLSEATQQIEEVMVVAYGTAKKSTFTGSATSVSTEKLEKISGSGFAEALQGLSAGMNVVNSTGNPGGDPRIQIRGIGSMSASSDPLYVVDGVPYDGKLNSISPSDIESMTVLKDAAASSLYGSRAANGVIVITTKKGKTAKPVINFKAAWGTSDLAVKNPTKASPSQQLTNTWEGMYNDQFYKYGMTDADARKWASDNVQARILKKTTDSNGNPIYVSPFRYIDEYYVLPTGEVNPNLQMVWDKSDYDWYGAVFSYKLRQDYSMDVSGSANDGKTNYFFSASYLDDKGYGLTQYFKRYGFRASASTHVTDWLEVGGSLAYSNSRQNTSGFTRSLIFTTTMASPWLRNGDNTDWARSEKTGVRMFDFGTYTNDFFGAQPMSASGDYWDNPNDYDFNNTMGSLLSSRFYMEIKLPWNLKYRTNLSMDDNLNQDLTYGSAVHGGDQQAPYGVTVKTSGGSASRANDRINSMTWNNLLTYDKTFGTDHTLTVLAGQELYTFRDYYDYGYGEGIMQLGQYELNSTTRNWQVDSYNDKYALLSFLGKVDYGYKNKYYLSASFRSDGSSKFAKSNRWGNFFSVGGSWRMSMEPFMKDVKWVDNLSVRASYGTSGNDKLQRKDGNTMKNIYYAYQAYYDKDDMYENPGLKPYSFATPGLKWEKNAQFNAAAEFRVFNKFYGTVEYYLRKSKDLLYYKAYPLSAQTGLATGVNTNLGDIQNTGFEITVGANLITTDNLVWNIDANWSSLKNKITYLPGGEYIYTDVTANYKLAEGHSRYEFFMPQNAGIDPQTGNALYWITDDAGNRVITSDFSQVTTDDYQWCGSALPKGYGSLSSSLQYKDFDFSFMFYYSYGGKMYDYLYIERVTMRRGVGVIQDLVKDRWRQPGDNAELARWSDDDYSSTRRATDAWVFKNNYVRLRNVTLGYTLPKTLTRKVGINNLRVYITGDNLLTFGGAKKRYSDPETGVTGNNYNGDSTTDKGYPSSRRVYMGGLQLSF